ncbi:hypothetical protein [Streptomyces sp. NBC_00564]|uniref:hypothetical protein n=1 Tax=Streptomyces sp. NBC_00564 TaxID=2903663 RepID=UPI00352CB34B|nr:hypothetical protein OG256_26585 [Streptomyces sp. NBC_00564]
MAELNVSAFVPTHTAPPVLRSDDVQVRWVMPEIYYDLPIHEADDDEAIRLLEELVDKALPGAGEDEKTQFGVVCALGFDDLLAAGAEYAAIGVTAVDETPCTATVFAALVDSPEVDGGVPGAVREISSSLRRLDAGEVSRIELPCGPAVSYIGARESQFTGELTESGEGFTFPTSFIRVYVPFPNGTTMIMEMSTPTAAGWDTFSTMFGNTVSSIRLFNADGSPLITSGATGKTGATGA